MHAPSPAAVASSATPSPAAGFIPTRLRIEALGVDAAVESKPTEIQWDSFLHKNVTSFGIPSSLASTAWWSDGAKPGQDELAVIVGHTNHAGPAVFNGLAGLAAGAAITVSGDGRSQNYRVISVVAGLSKSDATALQSALEHAPADARLALVTCTGTFNGQTTVDNTVVFAAPTG